MYKLEDAIDVANILDFKLDKFNIHELLVGMNIELEHGSINEATNVTNDDPILTAKIALAHLNEFPNYYNKEYGLKSFEEFLKEKINDNNCK